MSLLLLLPLSLLASSLALDIGISYYPGNNLWEGESLILECRVSGITRYVQPGGSGSLFMDVYSSKKSLKEAKYPKKLI